MVKKLFKSVHIYRSYRQNKPGVRFWDHTVYQRSTMQYGNGNGKDLELSSWDCQNPFPSPLTWYGVQQTMKAATIIAVMHNDFTLARRKTRARTMLAWLISSPAGLSSAAQPSAQSNYVRSLSISQCYTYKKTCKIPMKAVHLRNRLDTIALVSGYAAAG